MTQPPVPLVEARIAAAIVLFAAVGTLFAMLHHPVLNAHGVDDALGEIAHEARLSQWVHGGVIALTLLMVHAFGVVSRCLHGASGVARLAFLAYATGSFALIGAALISGFGVPALADHYAGMPAGARGAFFESLHQYGNANQILAKFGTVCVAVAMLLWSTALIAQRGLNRVIGLAGAVMGVVLVAALAAGVLRLNVTGMTLAVASVSAWNVAIGVRLAQGRL